MEKPIKPVLFAVVVLAATVSVAFTLNMLDQIVHGQLYNYGLLFDVAWAKPYWDLLRITQVLLVVIAVATVANAVLTIRKYASTKKPYITTAPKPKPAITGSSQPHIISSPTRTAPSTTRTVERAPQLAAAPPPTPATPVPHVRAPPQAAASAPPTSPSTDSFSPETPGLIRCVHCGKAFTQPLRMLDFQGDRPRIVNICPFCNETIAAAPRQSENEHDSTFHFGKNNHSQKYLASQ